MLRMVRGTVRTVALNHRINRVYVTVRVDNEAFGGHPPQDGDTVALVLSDPREDPDD